MGQQNMPRRPEPWYMERRKAWFVQINKKQVKLGEGPPNKPPSEVMREYHRLLSTEGLVTAKEKSKATVPEVCEAFLAAREKRPRPGNANYVHFLRCLAKPNMTKSFSSVRPSDVEKIADSTPRWGETMKRNFCIHVSVLCKWAKEAGWTELNAMAGYEIPYISNKRERLLTDEEFEALIATSKNLQFRQIMMFMRGTGCRPSEACRATASHIHPDRPLVILTPTEHKTGRRTGKKRILVMPSDVNAMVRSLMERYPVGSLFRNSRGGGNGRLTKEGAPWSHRNLSARFRRYRKRLGLGDDVVPYLVRHAAATRWLSEGAPDTLVAKMMGHSGTNTLNSTYYHPDVDQMVDVADKAHSIKKPKAQGGSSSS